jgi:hypothetical protein
MVFGKKSKIEYDATRGPSERTADLYQNPQNYSFIHNYKVHFKRSSLQVVANKIDISVASSSFQPPPHEEVVSQFNNKTLVAMANPRMKMPSYHITNVEYKESLALPVLEAQRPLRSQASQLTAQLQALEESSTHCVMCGTGLPPDSRFCNKCGATLP